MEKPRAMEERVAWEGSACVAPDTRSWQPRRHRNLSFRPVALRPRLSTSLPFSLNRQFRSVAIDSQVFKCVAALNGRRHIIFDRDLKEYVSMRRQNRGFRHGSALEATDSGERVMVTSPLRTPYEPAVG